MIVPLGEKNAGAAGTPESTEKNNIVLLSMSRRPISRLQLRCSPCNAYGATKARHIFTKLGKRGFNSFCTQSEAGVL
jgi:hypothetical protein